MTVFLDSNVVIYAFSQDRRTPAAVAILQAGGFTISVQTLNEFVNVARRKLRFEWDEVYLALASIRQLSGDIRSLEVATHVNAVALAERYGFAFYDAMVVASALEARCTSLLSEDLHDGLVVDGRLTIRNPFGENLSSR